MKRRLMKEDLAVSGPGDGWIQSTVQIDVPPLKDAPGTTISVPGMWHRPLTEVCREALSADNAQERFHLHPYKRYWQPHGPGTAEERIYDEVYTSDAMIEEERKLSRQAPEVIDDNTGETCKLEKVVLALMFASDATHLAQFGTAKAWPVYLFYGNESKYDRCSPSKSAAEHVIFIPSVRSLLSSARIKLTFFY